MLSDIIKSITFKNGFDLTRTVCIKHSDRRVFFAMRNRQFHFCREIEIESHIASYPCGYPVIRIVCCTISYEIVLS